MADDAPQMTDFELLVWLAEHGTEMSPEELEAAWPRILEESEEDLDAAPPPPG